MGRDSRDFGQVASLTFAAGNSGAGMRSGRCSVEADAPLEQVL